MVDHEAMKKAVSDAMEELENNFCNECKAPYSEGQGGYTDLVTVSKLYKIWYCDDCYEYVENEDEYFS